MGYKHIPEGVNPLLDFPDYVSTRLRAPRRPLVKIPQTLSERTGPRYAQDKLWPGSDDLTRQVAGGEAQGQRIIVHGTVMDEFGSGLAGELVEVWQANAAGRYAPPPDGCDTPVDGHDAPLDPYFIGRGAAITDEAGGYEFLSIEPGAYPWPNHDNAWRPKHIHFSVFGPALATRLVTQMYFPGDVLLPLDPIYNSVPNEIARQRLVASFDLGTSRPGYALAYRFDIVLRGYQATPKDASQ